MEFVILNIHLARRYKQFIGRFLCMRVQNNYGFGFYLNHRAEHFSFQIAEYFKLCKKNPNKLRKAFFVLFYNFNAGCDLIFHYIR